MTPAINQGIASGASLRGLCVAYRAHLMTSGAATLDAQTQMAHSQAFIELAEFATAKGETVPVLCETQGGVPMSIMPGGQSTSGQGGARASNPGSKDARSALTLSNRP